MSQGAISKWLGGMGGYPWVAVAFVVVAIGFFGSILVTPAGFRWWLEEQTVHGIEQDGIVTYSYHGVTYKFVDTSTAVPAGTVRRNVYLIPSDPGHGQLTSYLANQIVDWVTTAGALVISGLFVLAGMVRKRRLRRQLEAARGISPRQTFGEGIDDDIMSRMIQRQRHGK